MSDLPAMMKTVWRDAYGPPDVLSIREIPVPSPGPGEILVRVRATTVNRTDCGALWGKPYIFRFFVGWPKPRHAATGTDFAGEVAAAGPGVTRFSVGDRVMGFDDNCLGSHAQYLKVSEKKAIARIPEGVSFDTAAASLEGAHYARNFMNKVPLKPGDEAIVYGATGAIGSAAIPLLKHAGLRVVAVCAGEHRDLVAGLGPDEVLDYTAGDWRAVLKGRTFPFVFDAVGKSTFGFCKPLLKQDGVYISSELGPGAQNIWYSLLAPVMRGPKVRFPMPLDIPKTLEVVTSLLGEGAFVPLIDRRYRLEDVREAFAYVASGRKVGNVILTME